MAADIGIAIALQGQQAYIKGLNSVSTATATEMGKVNKSITGVEKTYRDANGRLRAANGKFVSDSTKGFSSVSNSVGGLANKIPILGSAFSSILNPVVLVSAAVAGIGAALTGAVKKAATFEQTRVAFTTIIGDAGQAAQTIGEIRDLAAKTPFELPGLLNASKKLLAFGTAADEVPDTLIRLGDVASGVGISVEELSEIYGKANVQGRLFAEDINQLTGRGIPIIQELAKQYGVAESSVKGLVESGAVGFPQLEQAFKDLTSEGGKFFGLTAAQSQTLNGLLSTLRDSFSQISTDIGTSILPIIKDSVTGILSAIDVLRSEATFGDLFGSVGVQLDSIGQTIKAIFNDIADATAPLRKTLSETFGDGAGILQAVFLPAVSALSFALKGIAIVVKPVVAAFSSFLNEIIPPLAKAFDSVKQSISSVVVTLKSALAPVLGENGRLLEAFRKAAVIPLTIGLKALAFVIKALAKVVDVAFKAIAFQVKAAVTVFNIFKNGVKVVFETAGRIIDTFLSGIRARFSAAGDLFQGLFELDLSKIQQGAASLSAAFDKPLLNIRKNFDASVNNVINKNKIASDLQEAYEKGFSSFGAGSFNVFSESERARLIDDMQGAIGSGVYLDPADARAAFDAIPTAAKDAFDKAGKEGEAFQQKLGSISAKAAVGSVSALNDQIKGLNDRLSKAAPTANIDSINQQVKGLNLALEQVSLRNLGINVDLSSSVDTSAFTGIADQVERLQSQLSANELVLSIGGDTSKLSVAIAESESKVSQFQAGLSSIEAIPINVTAGNADAVIGDIQSKLFGLSQDIAENEIELNILGNTGGTDAQIQVVTDRIEALKASAASLKALEVGIDNRGALSAIDVIQNQTDALKASLSNEQLRIDVLTNTGTSTDALKAVRTDVLNLKGDIESLEDARLNIQSGNTSQVIAGVRTQIGLLENEIKTASLSLPGLEADPVEFRAAREEVAGLQDQLDKLRGYELSLGGKDLPLLEAQLSAVNKALASVPASNTAFQALRDQARDLAAQINQVNVFRVIADVDSSLPALKEELKVLEDRLAAAPPDAFLGGIKAQIEQLRAEIDVVNGKKILPEIKAIKLPPIDLGINVEQPDFSGVRTATQEFVNESSEQAKQWQAAWAEAGSIAFETVARGFGSVAEQLGADIGASIRQSFAPLRNESGETIADLQGQLATLNQQLAASPNSEFADEIKDQIQTVKDGIKDLNSQKITVGDAFANALKGILDTILVQVPKMIGTFLIQTGVGLGFPAGIPFILAGAGLVGLSGLIGGLFGGGNNNTGSQGIATPTQAAARGLTAGSRSGAGLSSFNAEETAIQNTVDLTVVLDADGIGEVMERRIIRSEENVNGRRSG